MEGAEAADENEQGCKDQSDSDPGLYNHEAVDSRFESGEVGFSDDGSAEGVTHHANNGVRLRFGEPCILKTLNGFQGVERNVFHTLSVQRLS